MTADTVFHRTRTGQPKWFLAAYLMGRDKRGVSAKFLQRELGVAYLTAWTMAHTLRHGLSEGSGAAAARFSGSRRDLHRRRKLALNVLRTARPTISIRCKRKRSGWSDDFARSVIGQMR